MLDLNHSISIKSKDTDGQHIVKNVKEYCRGKGISFSFIVLKLLKKHYNEIINGRL